MARLMTRQEKRGLPEPNTVAEPSDYRLLTRSINRYARDDLNVVIGNGTGRTLRTDAFARFILEFADANDGVAPFAFRLPGGDAVSLDWGCVGYLAKHQPAELDFEFDHEGFVVALKPTRALRERYDPASATSDHELIEDLQILGGVADETTRQRLIDARLKHGRYRRDLERVWESRCAVTGCDVREVLRASHIKPWRDSTDVERLDPKNGLLLMAQLDALFDRGLISFDSTGDMLVADGLRHRTLPGVDMSARLRLPIDAATESYLAWHRERLFGAAEAPHSDSLLRASVSSISNLDQLSR